MTTNIDDLLKEKSGIRLDIGGGGNPNPGFINIDIRDLPSVDIVHDLNCHPWPLPDESVILATASHLVEHIPPCVLDAQGRTRFLFMEFMNEVWRVLKVGGEFAIACPHGSSQGFLQDPTHCNQINETTWAYFDPFENRANGMLYRIYSPLPWRIKYLVWSPSANIEVVLVKRSLDEVTA